MSSYTVESTYHLPVFRHRTYDADTVTDACRMAIEEDEWATGRFDHDSAGETYVTGIWEGVDVAYSGRAISVPSHFEETIQRKAAQFELLLDLLKMMVADAVAHRASPKEWVQRASWAVARGEAILAGARDPDVPAGLPKPSHALAWLEEDRVRDQITAILETDPDFEGLSRNDVNDNDVHAACWQPPARPTCPTRSVSSRSRRRSRLWAGLLRASEVPDSSVSRPTNERSRVRSPCAASSVPLRSFGLDAARLLSTGKPFPRKARDGTRMAASRRMPHNGTEAMAMCKVLNKHASGIPVGAVYIGRGSKWGNPFRIGPDGDRAAVIAKHERWLADQHHLLRALDELQERNLVCFCAPLPCHGDLLVRLANASRDERIAWWRRVTTAA